MKLAVTLIAAGIVGVGVGFVVPAFADDAHVGVGVGPVGAGVTVGSDHRDYDRNRDTHTTIIKERPVHEHTTIIKKEHEEPHRKVIIHEDRD